MSDEKKSLIKHKILIDQRERLSVTGVTDVVSFDEDCVVCETEAGVIVIKGGGLHVNNLNVDSGELSIEGSIDSVVYEEARFAGDRKSRSSVFGRIFK